MKPNYLARTADFEGFKPSIYKDTKGKRTIGYGFNLDDPYVKRELKKKGYNVTNLIKGAESLTEQESQKLLSHFYDHSYKSASRIVKNFKNLPENVQHNLADLNYNLGTTKLLKFRKMLGAIENYDFKKAAAELKDSDYYNQTKRRGKALYEDFLSTKPVQPPAQEAIEPVEEPGLYTQAKAAFSQVAPFIPGGELVNKLLPYAQGGKVDKYKSIPRTGLRYPNIINLPKGERSYYSPNEEAIYLAEGEDPTVLQHEMFHHWQKLNDNLSSGPVAKPPMMANVPNAWYNRRLGDIQEQFGKFYKRNPSFINIPSDLTFSKAIDPTLYNNPNFGEGEAEEYQNYIKAGGEPVFPEQHGRGGLIKRKDGSYSKRGLWDNIRANKGSGRKPTKEMLRQEAKIRAAEKKEDGGPIYNWIPPNYPRVGARNEQGGWLDQYADGGDVPHDYMYSQGNVSSYLPGTSVHPAGITNVPDSPCGPGFTVQYDETGNPVCMPIATPASSAPSAPTPVLAGANAMDYMLFNPEVYSPLATYSVERIRRGRDKGDRIKPTREERREARLSNKALKASDLHRRPFLSGVGQFFRNIGNAVQRCLPGDDCYKFEEGSWVADQSIPIPTTPSYYAAYPDKTLTNYQMGTPKSNLPIRGLRDATPEIPAYAHGATVWTKQTTPSWVAGTPTPTTTQREIVPSRTFSPGTAVPYPEVKITGPTDPYGPASPPVLQGYNPYKGPMRLHAPDTRRMGYGGYVPMYKKGGFLSTLGDIGLGVVDSTLGSVGSVTGIKSMQDIIDEDQYANDKFDDVAGFTGKIAGTALKVIPVTAPFAAAAGAVGTVANRALKIDEKNYDPTQHTSSWDKWGSGIEAVGGIASMAMGNVSGAAGAASNLSKAAQVANTIGKGANLVNAGMGVTQGLGQGRVDVNSLLNMYSSFQGLQGGSGLSKTGNLGGIGDIGTSSGMLMAKHGGRITKKYNPPGLKYQALNPGVSAPAGMTSGPTTQRGITFADGGDVLPYVTSDPKEFAKRQQAYNDSAYAAAKYPIVSNGKFFHGDTLQDAINFKNSQSNQEDWKDWYKQMYTNFDEAVEITNKTKIQPVGVQSNSYIHNNIIDTPGRTFVYAKPKQKVIFNPEIAKMSMRGISPLNVNVKAEVKGRPTYRNWNTGEVMYNIPEHLKTGSNWRSPEKKADGGDVDTLYVQSKNDPALRAYRDSSAAYETSQKFGKIFRKDPYDPEMMKYAKEIAASTDRLGLKPYKFLRGYDESSIREIPAEDRRLEEFWGGETPTIALYKKPVRPVVYNPRPDMAKVPMRGMTSIPMEQIMPQRTSVGRTPELPATYRSWNTGEELEQIPAHLKIGSNWRTPQFKKKNGGWLDNL